MTQGLQPILQVFLEQLEQTSQRTDLDSLYNDPGVFADRVLGTPLTSNQQLPVVESLLTNRFVAVESGHAVGKTHLAATTALWWLATRDPAVVITTAPTYPQVANQLWRIMRHLFHHSKHPLPGRFFETPRWDISANRFALGLSTRKNTEVDVATMQGFHSVNILLILDEAAGLPRNFWQASTSLVTGESNRLLAIGNPVGQQGPFFEACNSPNYRTFRLSCLDHPNVTQGREVIPGAVSRLWIEERLHDWATSCPGDTPGAIFIPWLKQHFLPQPIFRSRVLGEPPEEREDQLIAISLVTRAQERWGEARPGLPLVIGLDPARYGESQSVAVLRAGRRVQWIRRRQGQSLMGVAGWAAELMRETGATVLRVDETGLGAGVVDALRSQGISVQGIMVSRGALNRNRFANLRAEIWWRLRHLLQEERLFLPPDSLLEGEISAVRFQYDHVGRIILEDKTLTSERLGRSPDAADALCLTLVGPRDAEEEGDVAADLGFGPASESRWRTADASVAPSLWIVGRSRRGSRWRR